MTQIITNSNWGWAWGGGWEGDMKKSVYDPQNINADAFDYDNFTNTPDLSGYQTTSNLVTDLTNPDNTHYPSAKAVSDAITSAWGWDMLKSVYDPNNVAANAFDYNNFINTPTIPAAQVQSDWDEADNTQVDYIKNKPTIPTVNNSTIEIQKNWTKVKDFTLNQSSWETINITVPTDTSDLTNWAWFVTSSIINDTAYGSSWDSDTTHSPTKNAVYDKISSMDTAIGGNTTDISTINWKIPSAATSSNQLADKDYVNDGINSVTAYYITKNAQGDQWATRAELFAATTFYSGWVVRVPTKNDYTIVLSDENHDNATTRYIYNSGWEYQYTVNETALTQAQLDALNSWITSWKVSTYDGYATSKQDNLVNQSNIKSINNNSLLGSWNITLNDVKVSATAPSSPTEWMVWYDTTNDQLKVYDWTNWQVTGKEYNAWPWIEIKNLPDYSAMQWPAPSWFHVPLTTEWQAVYDVWTALGGWSPDWTNFWIALKLPCAGSRRNYNSSVYGQGSQGFYWSSSPYPSDADYSYHLAFFSTNISPQYNSYRALGYSVRCFKDTPIIPTSSWTKLYWTSIEAGWIFWSSTDWLISLSSDWTTWITISDKNLWATTVWNNWDTLSEANWGKYYQWGNNYWFAWTWSLTTSWTQVDASVYWPWNYYSSSTFITWNNDRSSVQNDNLWWWETWVVTIDNAITNTGVLSVNWNTWAVILDADDISDSTTTNKFVTATDKSTWSWKQDALVSWTNIKTVNWNSLLGSGNLTISWWISLDSSSPITVSKLRVGTEAQYSALATKSNDTIYMTV